MKIESKGPVPGHMCYATLGISGHCDAHRNPGSGTVPCAWTHGNAYQVIWHALHEAESAIGVTASKRVDDRASLSSASYAVHLAMRALATLEVTDDDKVSR